MPDTVITIDLIVEDDRWLALSGGADALDDLAAQIGLVVNRHDNTVAGTASLLLTDDAAVRDLNRDFRGKDKPTNVLSFPSGTDDGYLGDIAVAFETVSHEAETESKEPVKHLAHMVVHGLLHLAGYDHETDADADRMENMEIKILKDMGIENPYTG